MGVKLGTLDISAFKVGSDDCKVYLGDTLLYPEAPPVFEGKYKLTLSDSSTVSAECDSTSAVTSEEVTSQYGGTVVSAEIGNCVTSIGYNAFSSCRSLTSIVIPNSVTSIGGAAFRYCSSLTSVVIPSGVTSIANNAFYNCTSLTSIDIPNSVTSISNSAFQGCSGLTSCTIGSGVTTIGNYAFRDCSSLTSITVEATTPPTLSNVNAFNNTNNCIIYVPSSSVDTYKAANRWSSLSSRIQAIPNS